MTRKLQTAILGLILIASFSGCGGGDSNDDSFLGICCLNGAFYNCPTNDAEDSCVGGDASQCTVDHSQDGDCI